MPASKDVKCVQITIWLGNTQEFQVVADERFLNQHSPRDPCVDQMHYSKKDAVEKPSTQKLIKQLLTDLKAVFKAGGDALSIAVEGNEIVPK